MKWNPAFYDRKHHFVSKYGEAVLELLHPQGGENILDVGCGTGDLANRIKEAGATVMGIDSSHEMIEKACEKFPEIHFEIANAIDFDLHQQFDAVFSNATLHWIKKTDHPKVLNRIQQHLKPQGRLIVEMGGDHNVVHIRQAIQRVLKANGYPEQAQTQVWFFPSQKEYSALLKAAGFEIEYMEMIERPTPLQGDTGMENWLKMFSKQWFIGIPSDKIPRIIEEIRDLLRPDLYRKGKWIADYERFRFKGIVSS